jgi:hypothetical protein
MKHASETLTKTPETIVNIHNILDKTLASYVKTYITFR